METEHTIEKKAHKTTHSQSQKDYLDWLSIVLVIIGGLNWGLVGAINIDLVQLLFGGFPMVARIIYILVGLAAVYMIYFATKK
ncbi:protein of unknown function DUF378 [Methanococcus vannielii SB]|uniref:DUF378 domain-containing protein n=1 Tax=Methanococcus vannielii (strain ATCC 35089 / DSM 1224 / JCM 13029 / OCM 148 / SB) TaxID=406327 RepID=A6US43_METVS|nr:DUF378 domain-containing protein [Methanococcus vannielii]ABR55315.1 protein of unknown function DUF378 [Methanococcus vannielii SB]